MELTGYNVGNEVSQQDGWNIVSLAFGSSDSQPYVAYTDWWKFGKATVMKFDGTNWVNVGNVGFSAGEADYTSLAFSPSGQPYVAYEDYANS